MEETVFETVEAVCLRESMVSLERERGRGDTACDLGRGWGCNYWCWSWWKRGVEGREMELLMGYDYEIMRDGNGYMIVAGGVWKAE